MKVLGEPGVEAEYLYWVGCAGSFDDRNRKVTLSTARLLQQAGVDFAILGPRESASGDPARRTGNYTCSRGWRCRTSRRSTNWDHQDHHPVPPLLQHTGQRVPAIRR